MNDDFVPIGHQLVDPIGFIRRDDTVYEQHDNPKEDSDGISRHASSRQLRRQNISEVANSSPTASFLKFRKQRFPQLFGVEIRSLLSFRIHKWEQFVCGKNPKQFVVTLNMEYLGIPNAFK